MERKILSVVEYPLQNPVWFLFKIYVRLENDVRRLFNMEVDSFPKQLTNVITLKFQGSRGSHLCLHTGIIIPID